MLKDQILMACLGVLACDMA